MDVDQQYTFAQKQSSDPISIVKQKLFAQTADDDTTDSSEEDAILEALSSLEEELSTLEGEVSDIESAENADSESE